MVAFRACERAATDSGIALYIAHYYLWAYLAGLATHRLRNVFLLAITWTVSFGYPRLATV